MKTTSLWDTSCGNSPIAPVIIPDTISYQGLLTIAESAPKNDEDFDNPSYWQIYSTGPRDKSLVLVFTRQERSLPVDYEEIERFHAEYSIIRVSSPEIVSLCFLGHLIEELGVEDPDCNIWVSSPVGTTNIFIKITNI